MPRWFLTSEASIRYLQSSTQQVQQKAFLSFWSWHDKTLLRQPKAERG